MTKPRSLKKGESPTWEVGRKATGLKRNKALTIRFTEDELKIINETLERFKGSKSDSLLKIINKIKKIIEEEVQNMNKIKKYMQKYNIMPSENKSNDTLVGLEYLIIKSQEYPSIWLRITEEYIALSFMDASNKVVKLWEVMKKKLGFENKENKAAAGRQMPLSHVDIFTAQKTDIPISFDYTATVASSQDVIIYPKVGGTIIKQFFKPGSKVKAYFQ